MFCITFIGTTMFHTKVYFSELMKPDRAEDEEDYEELLEKLRVADFLYTEYSLEEVIYQLSKIMFTQSLTRGSVEAQAALQKFTNFLETEAEEGHISRALEKKVLGWWRFSLSFIFLKINNKLNDFILQTFLSLP